MTELPLEILEQIAQYSDNLTHVTLGLSINKEKLLEEGGPGKVFDDFLSRGGNLHFLKKWLPAECAIMHAVLTKDPKKILKVNQVWNADMFSNQGYELSVVTKFIWGVDHIKHDRGWLDMQEYYAFCRQWDKMKRPIGAYSCHPKYLLDAPEGYLEEEGKMMVSLYRGEKVDIKSYKLSCACIKYDMWKQAVDVVPEKYSIVDRLYRKRSMEGLRYLGIFDEKRLRAYEASMEPDDTDICNALDDEEHDMYLEISLEYFGRIPWHEDGFYQNRFYDIGCKDTSWVYLLERALNMANEPAIKFDGREHVYYGSNPNNKLWKRDTIFYPYPPSICVLKIYDISAIDIALFFWAKHEIT